MVEYPRWLWLPILERIILRKRPARIARLYQSIWSEGGSPLRVQTEKLREGPVARGPGGLEGRVGLSLWPASIANRVAEGLRDGGESLHGVCSPSAPLPAVAVPKRKPHGTQVRCRGSPASTPAARNRCRLHRRPGRGGEPAARGSTRQTRPPVGFVSLDSPGGRPPGRRGLYRIDCKATFEGLLAKLEWDPPRQPGVPNQSLAAKWIGPSTAATLAELPSKGVRFSAGYHAWVPHRWRLEPSKKSRLRAAVHSSARGLDLAHGPGHCGRTHPAPCPLAHRRGGITLHTEPGSISAIRGACGTLGVD
ncbi:MAG: ferrochelatase [Planctomycetota bacterium]